MMSETEKIVGLIQQILTVVIPTTATLIASIRQSKQAKKHAAKQSILQMIMEDQLNWELFRKFPVNHGNIQDEYEVYHKNGGNGEVTKRVNEYNAWYAKNEDAMHEFKSYSCSVDIIPKCTIIDDSNKDQKGGQNVEKLNNN